MYRFVNRNSALIWGSPKTVLVYIWPILWSTALESTFCTNNETVYLWNYTYDSTAAWDISLILTTWTFLKHRQQQVLISRATQSVSVRLETHISTNQYPYPKVKKTIIFHLLPLCMIRHISTPSKGHLQAHKNRSRMLKLNKYGAMFLPPSKVLCRSTSFVIAIMTGLNGVTATFYTCIRDGTDSNLGRNTGCHECILCGFGVPPGKCRVSTSMRPSSLPSISLKVHHSSVTSTIHNELLRAP